MHVVGLYVHTSRHICVCWLVMKSAFLTNYSFKSLNYSRLTFYLLLWVSHFKRDKNNTKHVQRRVTRMMGDEDR